jgi:phytoene dehydrogenase-like protein
MSAAARYDAVVIGGGISGLVAAARVAQAGHSVLLLDAGDTPGGSCRPSSSLAGVRLPPGASHCVALDPCVLRELRLVRHGLQFVYPDMPLVGLSRDSKPLIVAGDADEAVRAIASRSPADGESYRRFHREMASVARAMLPIWGGEGGAPCASGRQRLLLSGLKTASAADFLNSRFESEAVKSLLAFDAVEPWTAGSALALARRAAREVAGRQGAVFPLGGPSALVETLVLAAREAGVDVCSRARVTGIEISGGRTAGVMMDHGERISCETVLSSLSRHETLLDLLPSGSAGLAECAELLRSRPKIGEASILFLLDAEPQIDCGSAPQSARFIVADQLESYAASARHAREGRLPDELVLEAVIPTAADPSLAPEGRHLLSVRVPGLPIAPLDGWPGLAVKFVERVVSALEPHIGKLRHHIAGLELRTPDAGTARPGLRGGDLFLPFAARIAAPVEGLFFCGSDAEPVVSASGSAARVAAGFAGDYLAWKRRT